jgi:thiamine pyrophosphate-dependent acetolactate synthase large subunit-like protein
MNDRKASSSEVIFENVNPKFIKTRHNDQSIDEYANALEQNVDAVRSYWRKAVKQVILLGSNLLHQPNSNHLRDLVIAFQQATGIKVVCTPSAKGFYPESSQHGFAKMR